MIFSEKVVIVTGGGNGIGLCIAEQFAQQGAKVVVADLDEKNGQSVADRINKSIGEALFVKTDVREPKDIENLISVSMKAFGKIHILINNAGVSRWKSLFELTVDEWDDVLHTNLRSVFLCSREAAKWMAEGGAIVNIASTRAFMSEKNSEAYAASKGGIIALTHALAISLGDKNIMVNSISPGWIETQNDEKVRNIDHQQHPSGRVGTPDDIARACLYLTNPENNFVTGANLTIDGGMTKKMIYEE